MKYRIKTRYQWLSIEGEKWTKWYAAYGSPITDTPEELKDVLKEMKSSAKYYTSKTGRKTEYEIEEFDETIIVELKNIPKPIRGKRGRPKKVQS